MRKKIFIGLGVFLVLIVVAFFYLNNRNRTLSPPGSTEASFSGMTVSIAYSKPSARERLIFGPEADGALQPNGKYWRLGANEPTSITVSQDFLFGTNKIPAGTYDLYAIPGPDNFKLALNTGNRFWGYSEPDYSKDVASIEVPLSSSTHTEQFTIETSSTSNGVMVTCKWSDKMWQFQLTPQ